MGGLIITTAEGFSLTEPNSFQLLTDWMGGYRNPDLVNIAFGSSLFDILLNDLSYIRYDQDSQVFVPTFLTYHSHDDVELDCMRLLGKIAEAVIVSSCRDCKMENRKWAKYARRGRNSSGSLDNFIAVGTGLHSTFNSIYASKYSPSDTQRDILWVNKNSINEEMMTIKRGGSTNSSLPAGVQVKVSRNGLSDVLKKDIARAKYEVPIVYFDLCGDFYKLANAVYDQERNVEIGYDLIRGFDIDPSIHDLLHSYYYLIRSILLGTFPVHNLLNYNEKLRQITLNSLEELQKPRQTILIV